MIATIAAFTAGEPWLDQLLVTLDHRRGLLSDLLRHRLPMLTWHPPEATFLAWLNCAALGADGTRPVNGSSTMGASHSSPACGSAPRAAATRA